MRTKEKLRGEIADWIARSKHESKVAFEKGDLWVGLVWASRVFELNVVEEERRKLAYETGPDVDLHYAMVEGITQKEDYGGRIRKMMEKQMHPLYQVGIDLAVPGSDADVILQGFKKGLEELRATSRKWGDLLPVMATDEQIRERMRPIGKSPAMTGKHPDLVIIDDPFKE